MCLKELNQSIKQQSQLIFKQDERPSLLNLEINLKGVFRLEADHAWKNDVYQAESERPPQYEY
jgi:hypothetical protein